jgi:hypothetical protein
LVLLLTFLIVPEVSAIAQSQPKPMRRESDRVVVTPRKIVLTRGGEIARQFPEKRRATVIYPLVSGLNDPAALRRVRAILSLKNVFGSSLAEYRDDNWLEEFDYQVNHNQNHILDITFTQSGSAAYPDVQSRHFAINLKTGATLTASEVFVADKMVTLAALVDTRLQAEIQELMIEAKKEESGDSIIEALQQQKFEVKQLDDFSVGTTGITFLYDAGFPHVIRALQPNGEYFFSYADLKPFIKRDSLLRQFVR